MLLISLLSPTKIAWTRMWKYTVSVEGKGILQMAIPIHFLNEWKEQELPLLLRNFLWNKLEGQNCIIFSIISFMNNVHLWLFFLFVLLLNFLIWLNFFVSWYLRSFLLLMLSINCNTFQLIDQLQYCCFTLITILCK